MSTSARRTSSRAERPAAAKREAIQCDDHPDEVRTIRHGTAVPTSQKRIACPKAGPNRSRHRSADPRRARRAAAPERTQRFFLFHRARRILFLGKTKKRMGGASPVGAELLSIPAPFHRSHKTTSAAPSFCGRHRCHFHRSPWTIPLPDLRRRQRLPCAGIRCPGP